MKELNSDKQKQLRGGEELGGWCCAQYMTDPDELVGCFETAEYGECPADTEDFYFYNVSCFACSGPA